MHVQVCICWRGTRQLLVLQKYTNTSRLSRLQDAERKNPPQLIRRDGFQGRERRGGRCLTKYAEGNIWLGAARASSRLIGLSRGRGRLRHPSPAPLFPKVCLCEEGLLPKRPCLFIIHLGLRAAIKPFSPLWTLAG